jgi:hypothetical protein
MQCGSRFSVFRCVKTRRSQTTSLSKIEFLQRRPIASGLPHMRDMQVSQIQREFARLRNRERISFPARNQPALHRLSILGHDWLMGARAFISLKMRTSSALSGMAMIAVLTDRCEITA